ncbi:hypothetical protein BSPWISOXPB_1373 [uncultured Gammaproteobacteria bacterium]|nr:hypothetical protein BSPWISOXPB_1373 [uncultured Gammaproteobacteria bacterium]
MAELGDKMPITAKLVTLQNHWILINCIVFNPTMAYKTLTMKQNYWQHLNNTQIAPFFSKAQGLQN